MAKVLSAAVVLFETDLSVFERHVNSLLCAFEQALQKQALGFQFTIVDNSCAPDYRQSLELCVNRLFESASLPEGFNWSLEISSNNLGYGAGHNFAISQAASDYHLILNPDVYLDLYAIERCLDQMLATPDVALITPQIIDNYEHTPHVAKRYPSLRVLAGRYLRRAGLFSEAQDRYIYRDVDARTSFEVELAGGCFMFCRTKALRLVGGFDDQYFLYFEDFDLSHKLRKAGSTLLYSPDVKIQHDGGGVAEKTWQHHGYFIKSALRFFQTHGWKI